MIKKKKAINAKGFFRFSHSYPKRVENNKLQMFAGSESVNLAFFNFFYPVKLLSLETKYD